MALHNKPRAIQLLSRIGTDVITNLGCRIAESVRGLTLAAKQKLRLKCLFYNSVFGWSLYEYR